MASKSIGCPDCGSGNIVDEQEQEDPRQTQGRCSDCGAYSGLHTNGFRYPYIDPTDKNSGWCVNRPS